MGLAEIIEVLLRRWLVVALTFAVTLGAGFAALALLEPQYEATATLGLTPSATTGENPLLLLGQIDVITPLYAEAATAVETRRLARTYLPAGAPLGEISVRTFRDAPLVLKVAVRSSDAEVAQRSASAHVSALISRADRGQVGTPGLIELLVIDRPFVPDEPVWPRPKLVLLVAALLGVGFGVAAAFVRESMNGRIDSAELLSQIAEAPAFGEIPSERAVSRVEATSAFDSTVSLRRVAEAFRGIRTNLQFAVPTMSTVVVTSPEGHHGKTTVAFGLAAALAKSGARTLLVDGDLRRGRVEQLFRGEEHGIRKAPGLVDVLKGAEPEAAVQATDLATLSVLTSGELQGDPSELLESSYFSVLFRLERMFDVVVVDAPPLAPVNDARVLARYASATVLVAMAGSATRRQVRTAAERLRIIGIEPTAVVLNASKAKQASTYYLDRGAPAA